MPCRNEEIFIGRCLDSIIANDYPKDKLEILVVDGMSKDRTKEIVSKYSQKYSFLKIMSNPEQITPMAFNRGIKASIGEVIMIMGAHSEYRKDYISKCVRHLMEGKYDNVGGVQKILPQNDSSTAWAISYVLSSCFGVGNARYRIGTKKPMIVDTVWGGCYKREIFDRFF